MKIFYPQYRNRLVSSRSAASILFARFFFWSGNIFRSIFTLHTLSGYGITVIFFSMVCDRIHDDLFKAWKTETACADSIRDLCTVSCAGIFASAIFSEGMHDPIWKGIYFLCVLPSTVSTSRSDGISVAGGNIPAALIQCKSERDPWSIYYTFYGWASCYKAAAEGLELSVIYQTHYSNIVTCRAGISVTFPFSRLRGKNRKTSCFDQLVILSIVYIFLHDHFPTMHFHR